MTEAEAIAAQTAMLEGRLDTLNARLLALDTSLDGFTSLIDTFLTDHLTPFLGLLAQSAGGGYWIGYTVLGFALAYIVLRVIWSVTRKFA